MSRIITTKFRTMIEPCNEDSMTRLTSTKSYSDFEILCLKSQIEPFLDGLCLSAYTEYDSENNVMRLCFSLNDGETDVLISSDQRNSLEEQINSILSEKPVFLLVPFVDEIFDFSHSKLDFKMLSLLLTNLVIEVDPQANTTIHGEKQQYETYLNETGLFGFFENTLENIDVIANIQHEIFILIEHAVKFGFSVNGNEILYRKYLEHFPTFHTIKFPNVQIGNI